MRHMRRVVSTARAVALGTLGFLAMLTWYWAPPRWKPWVKDETLNDIIRRHGRQGDLA